MGPRVLNFVPVSVAKRKREGSRNAGILARPCPNRLGWEGSSTRLIAKQPVQTAETHRQPPCACTCVCPCRGASELGGRIASSHRWEPWLLYSPGSGFSLPTLAGCSPCTGLIHSLAPFILTPRQAPLLPAFKDRETEALRSHTLPRSRSNGGIKPSRGSHEVCLSPECSLTTRRARLCAHRAIRGGCAWDVCFDGGPARVCARDTCFGVDFPVPTPGARTMPTYARGTYDRCARAHGRTCARTHKHTCAACTCIPVRTLVHGECVCARPHTALCLRGPLRRLPSLASSPTFCPLLGLPPRHRCQCPSRM